MGFLVSQHGQLGAIPPPPFLSLSPLESMRTGGAIPPLKRGISAILARYPMKTRQMGARPPSANTISKRYCAIWGGISHWAAKQSHRPLKIPPLISTFCYFRCSWYLKRLPSFDTFATSGHEVCSRISGDWRILVQVAQHLCRSLSGHISRNSAILSLRYPISDDAFVSTPQNGAIPRLVLSFTLEHLCLTPFCNVSHDHCAMPHKNKLQARLG